MCFFKIHLSAISSSKGNFGHSMIILLTNIFEMLCYYKRLIWLYLFLSDDSDPSTPSVCTYFHSSH